MLTPGFFKQEEQTDLWFWFVPLEIRPSLPASSHTDLAPSFCCLKHPSFLPSIFPSSLFSPQSCFQELIMSFHLSLCLPHSLHPPSAFPPASFCLETSSPSPSSPHTHTHTLPFHLHPFLNVSPSFGPSIHPSCCMRSIRQCAPVSLSVSLSTSRHGHGSAECVHACMLACDSVGV